MQDTVVVTVEHKQEVMGALLIASMVKIILFLLRYTQHAVL